MISCWPAPTATLPHAARRPCDSCPCIQQSSHITMTTVQKDCSWPGGPKHPTGSSEPMHQASWEPGSQPSVGPVWALWVPTRLPMLLAYSALGSVYLLAHRPHANTILTSTGTWVLSFASLLQAAQRHMGLEVTGEQLCSCWMATRPLGSQASSGFLPGSGQP